MTYSIKKLLDSIDLLTIVGVPNPLIARMAQKYNFNCVYVSGACVANAELGLPDLAMTSLDDVCQVVRRMRAVCDLPILVDADTGWGGVLNVKRTVHQLAAAGASGMHLEDQLFEKRCGHRQGKKLQNISAMSHKIAIAKGTSADDFMVMARTDAIAVEGIEKAIERAVAYQKAGSDALFLEAATSVSDYQRVCEKLDIPVLANLTEFGKTPHFTDEALIKAGVKMKLYPLSLFRLMNHAAELGLKILEQEKNFQSLLSTMQSRESLYDLIDYESYEQLLDKE